MPTNDCPNCGYDRSGDQSPRCPECGTEAPADVPSTPFLLSCRIAVSLVALASISLYIIVTADTYALGVRPEWDRPDVWLTPDRLRRLILAAVCGVLLGGTFLALGRPRRLRSLDPEGRLAISVVCLIVATIGFAMTLGWFGTVR